jgi:hypothetical protein
LVAKTSTNAAGTGTQPAGTSAAKALDGQSNGRSVDTTAMHLELAPEETIVAMATGFPGVYVGGNASGASSGVIIAKYKNLQLPAGTIFTFSVGTVPAK